MIKGLCDSSTDNHPIIFRVGRDSYGPFVQSPFNTLVVCEGNEAMLMESGASQ